MRSIYTRLIEELSETAEAIRFHHLYPSNFSNELADYFAWWFALINNFNRLYDDGRGILLAEDILWNAYPGFCLECGLVPCDCRPGPVRELLSKPALNKLEFVDGLTQAENHNSFIQTIQEMVAKQFPVALPISCIRIDIDDFKEFNNEISHAAGDTALKTLVTVIRQKVRPRDRIFRVGGDEFAILCQDLSDAEAEGMMQRVAHSLEDKKIKGKNGKGEDIEKIIKLSIGIATCMDIEKIEEIFKLADDAAIESKQNGKNRITRK
jgi:diguanylate cyclase (GGDEF)-like protein